MLRLQFFGVGRVCYDGVEIELPSRTWTLAILAYIVLQRGQLVQRKSIAYMLWPDEPEDVAQRNLRRNLHRLVKALPATPPDLPWFVGSGSSIGWNPAQAYTLDVEDFQQLRASDATLDRAVACYRGDLLEESYADWIAGERERLRQSYHGALARLIARSRSARAFADTVRYATQFLASDPLREDVVRQLMAARYDSGDRAGALVTFDAFARVLRTEMNVDPMPETLALRDTIARNEASDVESETDADPAAARGSAVGAFAFVGRDAELEQLGAAWNRAAKGRGNAILVSGEAGIGKTRLVRELALRAEAEGGRVFWGGTSSPESVAYQAIADALRDGLPMIAAAALKPGWLATIAQIVPELRARIPDLPELPAIDPQRERTRLFDGIATTFEGLAAPRPIVVVLEDLHWAQSGTIAALEFLIARVARRPILLLATYREEDVARTHALRDLRRRLQTEGLLTHLSLPTLAREAVATLVASARLPDSVDADEIYTMSDGNPLFVGEIVRSATDVRAPDAGLATLREFISARFARLSPEARKLATIAATIGEGFDIDVLRETSTWTEAELLDALDELLDRSIVRESTGKHRYDYAFTHHLVQRAIYDSMPSEARERRHRRIARVLEDVYGSDAGPASAEIARHYDCCGDRARAAAFYLRAARAAKSVFANEEVLGYARKAIEFGRDDDELRFDALTIAEETCDRLGDRDAQLRDLIELEALARFAGDRRRLCEILIRKITYHFTCGDRNAEVPAIEALERELGTIDDLALRARFLEAKAQCLGQGDARVGLELARQSVSSFVEAGEASRAASALLLQAAFAVHVGEVAETDACIARAKQLAESVDDAALVVHILRREASVYVWREQHERFEVAAREMRERARALGDRDAQAIAVGNLAMASHRFGRMREARELYAESMQLFEAVGDQRSVNSICSNAGLVELFAGRFDRALALFERARAISVRCGDVYDATYDINCSEANSARENFASAFHYAQVAHERSVDLANQRLFGYVLGCRGAASLGLGNPGAALTDLLEAMRIHEQCDSAEQIVGTKAALALAYSALDRRDTARGLALEIARAYKADGFRFHFDPARTLWSAALVLHDAEDPQAPEVLRACFDVFVRRRDAYDDVDDRDVFAAAPLSARIVAAYERDEWSSASGRSGDAASVRLSYAEGSSR